MCVCSTRVGCRARHFLLLTIRLIIFLFLIPPEKHLNYLKGADGFKVISFNSNVVLPAADKQAYLW